MAADSLSQLYQRSDNEENKFWVENSQILHQLSFLLTNTSLSGLFVSSILSLLFQVFIYGTHTLPQPRQFENIFGAKLANKRPYKASISGMRLKQAELQEDDPETQKIKQEQLGNEHWQEINGVLYHKSLFFVRKAIQTELISRHHDDLLASHFCIKKTYKLLARKYHWSTVRHNVNVYIKGCDMCLTSKAVRHKPYSTFQSLLLPTYQ